MSESDLPEPGQTGAAVGDRELLEAISRGLVEVLVEQRETSARLLRVENALGLQKQTQPKETPKEGPAALSCFRPF